MDARSTKHKKCNIPLLPSQQSSRPVAQTHTNINTCLNETHVVTIVVEESWLVPLNNTTTTNEEITRQEESCLPTRCSTATPKSVRLPRLHPLHQELPFAVWRFVQPERSSGINRITCYFPPLPPISISTVDKFSRELHRDLLQFEYICHKSLSEISLPWYSTWLHY
jgi:hypothetical protein